VKNRPNVNNGSDVGLCMVVGCGRKAIYRNASTNRQNGSQRGYCSKHKSFAIESSRTLESVSDYIVRRAAWSDD
jgi:hypothetical protein